MSKEGDRRVPTDRILVSLLNPDVQRSLSANNSEFVLGINKLCNGLPPEVRQYLILKTARSIEGISKDASKSGILGSADGLFNFLCAIPTDGINLGPEDVVFVRNALERFPSDRVRSLGLIPEGTRIRRPGIGRELGNAARISEVIGFRSKGISNPQGAAVFWEVLSGVFSEGGKSLSKVQLAKQTGIHSSMFTNGPKRGNLPSLGKLEEIIASLPDDKGKLLREAYDKAYLERRTSQQNTHK